MPKELRKKIEQKHREQRESFKAKMDRRRTLTDRIADQITRSFGSVGFFFINFITFAVWIIWNNGWIPGFAIFDPYPYGMLTMVVSLEAICLSIFVLISQNHAANIADIREEVDLQVNVRSEEEITKILKLVDQIHDHIGLRAKDDPELREMKKRMNVDKLEDQIVKEMEDAE